eukprot:gene8401-9260_t
MRILIKGGVWKNTEDEILKAAVMKYGKNQWSRVASLLSRKSPKQCKARWYEWLDPSIKKTEWTRDEEEKLLHLAKLMPNQWRTIAPIVGRTAGQCMEHYERLLDQAAQEEGGEEMNEDDPRRLRPGEIDPAPETKPARPDPIDMDEDELEMLAEARARLANTKGKKAKRKMRERMMEESRRLATLQKRRELKAAGIESKLNPGGSRKRKFIDYAREIPFQKVVPAGFYDVGEEDQEAKKRTLDPKAYGLELSKLEGRHAQEEEERARKRDNNRLKKMFEENAPLAVLKVSAENDPASLRKRLPLNLPSPQVTESDLEDIVKLSKATASSMGAPEGLPARFSATQALIGDYSQVLQPSATPLRTPQQEDVILQEAKNLRVLREMTPLTTQELPELYEGTGFAGATPRRHVAMTPNALLAQQTPMRNGNSSVLNTPSGVSVAGSVMSYRDQFGLNAHNHDDSFSTLGSKSSISKGGRMDLALKDQLRSKLLSLPEPEYTYEVAIPNVVEEETEDGVEGRIEDAADIEARKRRAEQVAHELHMARRSSVLKRELPRPVMVNPLLAKPSLDPSKYARELVQASAMINEEMVRLVLHEIKVYPMENVKPATLAAAQAVHLEALDLQELERAQSLIAAELATEISDLDQLLDKTVEELTVAREGLLYVATGKNPGEGVWKAPSNKAETLSALKAEFKAAQSYFDKEQKRLEKLENKYKVLTQGYDRKESEYRVALEEILIQYNKACIELEGLESVRDQEARAAEYRLQQLKEEAKAAQEAESLSQEHLAKLIEYARDCGIVV